MPQKLPLTVVPQERETLPSFFSRMAALQGTDAIGFALDIGINFKRIVDYDPDAIAIFAARSGLAYDQLAQLHSWTGERVGEVRMRFRDEIMVSRALRNPVIRGCPICLRGGNNDQRPPLHQMVMQGNWLCRGVDICLEHRHILVPLWQEAKPTERENIGARLSAIWPELRDGRLDRETIKPTPYDHWLDNRLSGQTDSTWLAGQPLFAAMTFCASLGAELRRVQDLPPDDREAKATGFHVASRGPQAIEEAFAILTDAGDGAPDVSRGALGGLYDKLEHLYHHDPSFDGFRALLRDHVIRIWPLAAGDVVLGKTVEVRQVHSLGTASQEVGIKATVLDALLTEAGVFADDDTRPPSRKIFDARVHTDLLREITTRVGPKAMREAIGATVAEFRALVAEGVLTPRSRLPKIKNPWHLPDGQALVENLLKHADVLPSDATGWATIHMASMRSGIAVGRIIDAIREGRLQARRRPEVFGYHGIVVALAALEAIPAQQIGAAIFARSIGLRDYAAFTALIEAGHIAATQIKSPKTARLQWMMAQDEIKEFRQRYVTPTMIKEEAGLHYRTTLAVFSVYGVSPFRPDGMDAGPIYRREDTTHAISNHLKKR